MHCRFCNAALERVFIDLINSPASNSFLTQEQLNEPEMFYPLKVFVCDDCKLVQIDEYKKSDAIFNGDYVYFSSYSTSWLAHSKAYADLMVNRFKFNTSSLVVEIASNDGYLLQYFNERQIPVLGIEPTKNTAEVAVQKGVPTITEFFGVELANKLVSQGKKADLLLGNNVLAHVPDINDFVAGMKIMLNDRGVITMEFPHLVQLVENNQFDTIYHEHFSYLSFYTVKRVFESHGLEIFDVEEIPTHGGSLRVYGKHANDLSKETTQNASSLFEKEVKKGVTTSEYYTGFQKRAEQIKIDLLAFLLEQKKAGKTVVGYGAAAKGNTLLNYCGIKHDLIDFVVDANPHKQNKYLPASHIPVVNEGQLKAEKPDFILILPWNIKDEIIVQLDYINDWGGQFVVAIPEVAIIK